MKPKFSYSSASEIPEKYKDLYVEKDGKWTLDVEGAASVDKVTEFRDKNIALTKELADVKKEWDGFTKSEVEALIAKKKEIEDSKIKNEGEFNAKLKERTDAMKAEYDKKMSELEAKAKEQAARLDEVLIDKAIIEEGNRLGLRPEAAGFLTSEARKAWRIENGVPMAYKPDGKPEYGTDGEPLKMSDYAARFAKANAFAFQPSQGGGSQGGAGGAGGGGAGGENPWKQGAGFNRTKQGEIFREDPAKARRLAAEAGTPIP